MSLLRVTLIDVGWGDSLLLESVDSHKAWHYALIDSNDTSTLRSSHIYLKRFFERLNYSLPTHAPLFEWVLLTHAHADHGQGLKRILQDYGTRQFWYPKSSSSAAFFTDLLRYAQRVPRPTQSPRVLHHQSVDTTKVLPDFGDASMQILWPTRDLFPPNENNNSVVLALTLDNVSFLLTGDAEAEVWTQIAHQIPPNTRFFKVPHHGSDDAMFDAGSTPWLDQVAGGSLLAISSHIRPFSHPSPTVIAELDRRPARYYRTDEHYHITFETDGQQVSVKYSHI